MRDTLTPWAEEEINALDGERERMARAAWELTKAETPSDTTPGRSMLLIAQMVEGIRAAEARDALEARSRGERSAYLPWPDAPKPGAVTLIVRPEVAFPNTHFKCPKCGRQWLSMARHMTERCNCGHGVTMEGA